MPRAELFELSLPDCLAQLALGTTGRIAFLGREFPVVLTVNYRLVDLGGEPVVMVRTRPGSAVDEAPITAAFQIDGVDEFHRTGWWVLVQGIVRRLTGPEAQRLRAVADVNTWLRDRDAVLVVQPRHITGRRLVDTDDSWASDVRAYL